MDSPYSEYLRLRGGQRVCYRDGVVNARVAVKYQLQARILSYSAPHARAGHEAHTRTQLVRQIRLPAMHFFCHRKLPPVSRPTHGIRSV